MGGDDAHPGRSQPYERARRQADVRDASAWHHCVSQHGSRSDRMQFLIDRFQKAGLSFPRAWQPMLLRRGHPPSPSTRSPTRSPTIWRARTHGSKPTRTGSPAARLPYSAWFQWAAARSPSVVCLPRCRLAGFLLQSGDPTLDTLGEVSTRRRDGLRGQSHGWSTLRSPTLGSGAKRNRLKLLM